MLSKSVHQHIVDKVLLNGAEGYNADAVVFKILVTQSADYLVYDSLSLSLVLLRLALVVIAFGTNELDLRYKVFGRREGVQLVIVVFHIAVRNKALMA